MIRRIGKQGAITLPKVARAESGIHPGMAVDITVSGGNVVLTPTYPCCSLCGSAEDVHDVAGIKICRACAEKIKEVF